MHGQGDPAYENHMAEPVPFPGYYRVINSIVTRAFDSGADLVSCIGDDQLPPAQGAEEHTRLYFNRFANGLGVMQCTGDRQGEMIGGKVNSERICGSPTFGRAWHERAFQGNGAFGAYGFRSFYCDELLKEVAERRELLYQEPALKIDHVHWAFNRAVKMPYHDRAQENWDHDKQLFDALKAAGFPGSEPLP
jgi:hypothetical protein